MCVWVCMYDKFREKTCGNIPTMYHSVLHQDPARVHGRQWSTNHLRKTRWFAKGGFLGQGPSK